ncbi:MAG: hypothetical protein ACR2OZ_04255 [Verrucomicrobiales bacterium]
MKRIIFTILFILTIGAAAEDKLYDLQGSFAPPDATVVRWVTTTVLEGGTYTAVRGIVPMDGKIEQSEEREMVIRYISPSRREATITKSRSVQVEKFPDRKDKETRKSISPLEGVPLVGTLADSQWQFAFAHGEPTAEQAPDLARIRRRMNQEADLFKNATEKKIGDTWSIDPRHFLEAAGYDDVSKARGTVSATLRSVAKAGTEEQATVDLEIDVAAVLAPPKSPTTRLKLRSRGTVTRSLTTKLDLAVELNGNLTRSGQLQTQPGLLQPYFLVSPIKFKSRREIVSP